MNFIDILFTILRAVGTFEDKLQLTLVLSLCLALRATSTPYGYNYLAPFSYH